MKYSNTAVRELSAKYRSILKKCALLNAMVLVSVAVAAPAGASEVPFLAKNNQVLSGTYSGYTNTDRTLAGVATINYDTTGVRIADNTTFTNNATQNSTSAGGAIKALNGFTGGDGIKFNGNEAFDDAWGGGAMYIKLVKGTTASQTDSVQLGKNAEFIGNRSNIGGAIALEYGNLTIGEGTIFDSNTATDGDTQRGGAIAMWRDNGPDGKHSTLTLNGVSFKNNQAGSLGGAIFNEDPNATVTINENSSFTENKAQTGGAIYNTGTMTFNGKTVFSGNKANGKLNDIYNTGIINFNGDVTLDGGISAASGTGIVNFMNGTALTATLDKTFISGMEVNFKGNNTINMIVENTAEVGDHDFIEATEPINNAEKVEIRNELYNMTLNRDGIVNVAVKSGEELLADTPASLQEANTISAFVATAGEGTEKGTAIANQISSLMQTGHKDAAVKLAEEVAPTTSQTVMGVAQGVNSILNNVAGTRMAAVGRNGGDAFVGGAMWVQGLMNHTKQDSTSNAAGFSADTNGISFGIDGKVNENLMVGIGYGYTNTDADSGARDIDVDGHNFFAYTEYKPNKWYINGMFNYGFSKYDEQKVAGLQAKYDVNTYAANVMTGYDFDSGITPEVGLRYLLADQDSYNDGAQHVSTDKTDVLTGVVGVKYKADVKAKDWKFTPNLRLAATYDMVSDNSKANVSVIGGGNYQITGKRLNRFGVETGVGIETTYKDWNFSVDYNGGFRKDFQSHTGMLKAKYNF